MISPPPLILLFQALVSHSGSKNFSHDHTWPVLTGVGGDISGAKQQYPLSVHVCKHPRLDYLDSLHTHLVFHNIKKRRSFSIKIDYIMENKYSVVVILLTSLLLLLRSVWTVPQSRFRWKLDLSSHNLNKFHFYHSNTPARLDPCKFNSNHWRKHVFLTLWNVNSFVSRSRSETWTASVGCVTAHVTEFMSYYGMLRTPFSRLVSVAARVSLLVKVQAARLLCHVGIAERDWQIQKMNNIGCFSFDVKVQRTYRHFSNGALLPV